MASQTRAKAAKILFPSPLEAPKESAISRLLIAPIAFVAFLISLAVIDSRNHSLRTHSHPSSRPQPTTVLGRLQAFLHGLIYKQTPSSPYAYIKSPDSQDGDGKERKVESRGTGGKGKGEQPWHWHTKQRHMMAAEMEDAFRVRKWVVVFLVGVGVLLAWCAAWVVSLAWRLWNRS